MSNEDEHDEEWLEQMPKSFQVLWRAAGEMGALDKKESRGTAE